MKTKKQYTCTNCGSISYKWYGRCSECNEWNSIIEDVISNNSYNSSTSITRNNLTISSLDKDIDEPCRIVSSINELNRVLGGGLIPESAILIGGDPGIGKSTLLLQLCAQLSTSSTSCFYISGEESVNQIKLRAQRLGLVNTQIKLLA